MATTTTQTKPVRIGNAHAFWGDRADAAAEMLAREPDLDYITLDYLAEVSMSILAMQRERDPAAGFPRDFLDVVRSLAPYWAAGGRCRLITNAGGLNPRGCAETCIRMLEEAGCQPLTIGVVSGDDVLADLVVASPSEFTNLDTGEPIGSVQDRLVTGNAYFGAAPIAKALALGADIVITGRVADPSLVVAPCLHHFGWTDIDYDRLAGATVAGHLIECGTQVTGGISTDWLDVPDVAHIGFPIVEVEAEGSCIVTKPRGSGGHVSPMTVKEQLVYEIGDPGNYLSPDVAVSLLSLSIEDLGNDRVRVKGATGRPRPDTYKVSATYRDGYRAAGSLTIVGRDTRAKAERCGALVLQRVHDAGLKLHDSIIECLGTGAVASGILANVGESSEVVLRIAVESDSYKAVECFTREMMPFVTAGPQGTTGYAEGRPHLHGVFRYWPCLIPRTAIAPRVEILASRESTSMLGLLAGKREIPVVKHVPTTRSEPPAAKAHRARPTRLYDIACARSGDKGTSANIGVVARDDKAWRFLQTWLTADRVAMYFAPMHPEAVERFELPNLGALNFILHGVLKRGLRTDAQGKALGQILLELALPDGWLGSNAVSPQTAAGGSVAAATLDPSHPEL
jgi:hypothetical protein